MSALTLGPITPAGVRAFGVVISLMTGGVCGLAALAVLPAQHSALVGVLAAGLVFGSDFAIPNLFRLAYRIWNGAVRSYSRIARKIVTAICFFVVIGVAGRAGSSLAVGKPRKGQSLWTPHLNKDSKPSESQYMRGTEREVMGFPALLDWARNSGNGWAVALVPFFALLLALEADATYEAPADIYTLF